VNAPSLEDRDVNTIYDAAGLLLILGEPGSGKTTTLLDLARILLDRAGGDLRERVPIIVNLSSWKKNQPLGEWISGELSEKYRVPVKIARSWLKNHYLLPLLDGLDEVETTVQPDCVGAINTFIDELNPPGLVVCCRLNEYRWLPERLKLNGAICLEPLSSEEVSKYLAESGPKLVALREAVNTDPVLQELAETPLMLSIMSLAFQGTGGNELATQKGDSPEERRRQIFRLYVKQMFQRKGITSLVFPKEKIIGWLSWLAGKMRESSQSVFVVEGLQPSWLGTTAKRAAYGPLVALSLGLLFGLTGGLTNGATGGLTILVAIGLGCWAESPLKNGVMSGSIAGLIAGLIVGLIAGLFACLVGGLAGGLLGGLGVGSLNHINLVETISWKWNLFWKRTIPGLIAGLIAGLFVWLMLGLISGLMMALIFGIGYVLTVGVIVGLVGGLVTGLVGGFTDRVKVGKASPNQGIKLSLKSSSVAFLVASLSVGLILALILGLIFGLSHALTGELDNNVLTGGLIPVLIGGLTFGLIVGLNRGGSAVIKHYVLRLVLWLSGSTPFKFVKFLDHCARLILLKKVGGGYIFIHRMLLDYFAEMSPLTTRTEDGIRGVKHALPINWSRRIAWASFAMLVCAASLWFFVLGPRADLGRQAVAASRRALGIYLHEHLPQQWAMIQLGEALYDEGVWSKGAKSTELLDQAAAASRRALEVYTHERFPQQWATTQTCLAQALYYEGIRSGGAKATELLGQAAAAYRGALEVFTLEQLPQQWVATQTSLAQALYYEGIRSEGTKATELLGQAVAAFRSALKVRTREQLPQDWAVTQTNLGQALYYEGIRSEGAKATELLGQAVAAFRSALEVFTREQLPQQWAITQNNLGNALQALSNQLGGEEGLKRQREAVELLRDVMSYQSDDLSRNRLASALGGLAFNWS
jgi:hypothetical protein